MMKKNTWIPPKTFEPGTTDFSAYKAHFIETAGDYFGATGRTELDENGDRKHVFYDFWTVRKVNGVYTWEVSAKYNTTDQLIHRGVSIF